MRTRYLVLTMLGLVGLVTLLFWAAGVAVSAATPGGQRPTPTPEALPPDYKATSPSAPEALPDLIVQSIRVTPADPYVGQSTTIVVTVKNVGTADVTPGNNTFLDLYFNPTTNDLRGIPGDRYWPVQGYSLRVGRSIEFITTTNDVFVDTASYNIYAQIDTPFLPNETFPRGHVLESNEDNNVTGPVYVTARTHFAWLQKNHVDFFRNMASTLDVVPVAGTVGIITNTPGLVINGDSALVLGIFDEPPKTTWGNSGNNDDYNMIKPDSRVNQETTTDQRLPYIHAATIPGGMPGVNDLVVAVWEDGRGGPTYGRDVYLRWSDDAGETWNLPADDIRVNDDVGYADQKNPAVAVAPNGDIVVAWQDNRLGNFDIFVQVFQYSVGSLTPSGPNFRVVTDAGTRDQILPDIAVDDKGNFYVVWQDQRNNNDDIFAVRSYTSTLPCPSPSAVATEGLLPVRSIEQPAAAEAYNLCWGHDARIHDDPSFTRQASPDVTALRGDKVKEIVYSIVGDPPALVITDIITEPISYVVAVWEDDREGDTDIYMTYSSDGGKTFAKDQRLNNDKPANTANGFQQLMPEVAMNQWMKWLTISRTVNGTQLTAQVQVPVATMHVVWQDFRSSARGTNNDPDIYYATITAEPYETNDSWDLRLVFTGQQKVNQNDWRPWQTGPVWQSDPHVAATSSGPTLAESDAYNAFVTWSDWRNYGAGDFDNVDVYFRLFTTFGTPSEFVGGNNVMVNDNVRLHSFNTLSPANSDYRRDMPPHARQRNPSIASTLIAEWPTIFGGYVYVAWDDDRQADPFADRNVYLTRSNMLFGGHRRLFTAAPGIPGQGERYASGAFISEIFDSGSDETKWYAADWHAVTDDGTYITLQTRMGNSRAAVLASDWYPKRFPYPDDAISKGAPLQGYDAPGQHIVDSGGNMCPAHCPVARYIQYRVNFWARDTAPEPDLVVLNTPVLYDVILHYDHVFRPLYMPLIMRNH